MLKLIQKFLCWIGLHDVVHEQTFYPHQYAETVMEYKYEYTCSRCPKVLHKEHRVWYGWEHYVDADPKKHTLHL